VSWFLSPFAVDFMQRALLGGVLVAAVCAVVGTWVVIRGMAFLGEALGHGMLPGVAVASLVGAPAIVGAALAAAAMSLGVGALRRRGALSHDTSIGLLFVGMLSAGVIVISHSRSFATDVTAILFGDILAIGPGEIVVLAAALCATVLLAAVFHRPFVAAAVDPRIAHTLRLGARRAHVVLVGLVTLAVVASYQAVGSLLVVGLLLAPAVAATPWTRRIPTRMALAAAIGAASVLVGLLISWHAATAAGASVALAAIVLAALSSAARAVTDALASSVHPSPTPEVARATS
jgi:zinc/manganese transport system permease protein